MFQVQKYFRNVYVSEENVERTSATSKDALLENDISNSSATPEMHDARTDCNVTDNENSERKLSECSYSTGSDSSPERLKAKRDSRLKTQRTEFLERAAEDIETRRESITRRGGFKRRGKNKKVFTAVASQTSSTEEHTEDSSSTVGLHSLFQISDNEHEVAPENRGKIFDDLNILKRYRNFIFTG